MTAAPQGTLIQIFVELSKWGVGEPPSWSVSRQVARRWLVTGRQCSELQDPSQKGLRAPDGAMDVVSQEREGEAVVQLWLPGKWRRTPTCNWWLLGWGSLVCSFANGFEQRGAMGASAHSSQPGSALLQCHPLGRDRDLGGDSLALLWFPPVREEQGLQSQASSLQPTWPLFSVMNIERVKRCVAARSGLTPHCLI